MPAFMAVRGEPAYPWVLTAKETGFYDARMNGERIRLAGPYGESVIQNVMFKFVPAGMHGQTAAECAFRLHPAVAGRVDEIGRIVLRCHRTLTRIMDKRGVLRNAADRDHCAQYIVAAAPLHGNIGPHDFEDAFAADPLIDALRAKMELAEEPRYTADFSDPAKRSSANSVEVFFRDGTSTGRVEVEYPAGHPRRRAEALPMLRRKFEASLARRFAGGRPERILALCEDGAQFETTPVQAFVDLLKAQAPA